MSLSLLHDTHPMTPVRNPAWMEVLCMGYLTDMPEKSEVRLTLIQDPDPGYTIYFELPNGDTTTLVAVNTTPDDSGTQYAIGGTTSETFDNLLDAAQGNAYLSQWYQMDDMGTDTMRLRGRVTGAHDPLITWDTPACIALSAQVEGTSGSFQPGYVAQAAIYLEKFWDSGTYERLPVMEKMPDTYYRARWDLSSLLHPYLRRAIVNDWPAYGLDEVMLATNIFRRYYVDRWERYGQPPTNRKLERSDIKLAWYAGARNRDHNTDGELGGLLRYTHRTTPWMTYRDRGGKHEVSAAQQHVLGWYRKTDRVEDEPIRMVSTVHYTDGTTAAGPNVDDSGVTWEKGSVALWPCGFDTLELGDLEPTKTPYKYSVKLVDFGDADLSEVHTFWLVDADANELHLEFVNSLGVVESMRCIGSWVQELSAEYEDLTNLREVENGTLPPSEGSNTAPNLLGVMPTLQVSTGFVEEKEHYALLDILHSPYVRLVDHANDRKLPVRLAPGTHALRRQGPDVNEHLHALNLALVEGDAEMAWGDRYLLPRMAAGEIAVPNVPQDA